QEIIGNIYIPLDFKLELDFGMLSLAAPKLRSITFTDADRKTGTAKADTAPSRAAGEAPDTSSTPPRYFRHEHAVIVGSPAGARGASTGGRGHNTGHEPSPLRAEQSTAASTLRVPGAGMQD